MASAETGKGMGTMRILNSSILHGWSAASWYAVSMMGGLAERGHEISFLVPEGRTADCARDAGIEVISEPDLRKVPVGAVRSTTTRLRKAYEQLNPDLVIVHHGTDHVWWGLTLGGKRRIGRAPLVRMRVQDPRRPPAHPAARWLNTFRTDAFIVSNETQRSAYVGRIRLKQGSVYRVPPGFDPSQWRGGPGGERIRGECGITGDTMLVASIARFAPQKDHSTFFAAAEMVARSFENVHFLVAGYPSEYDSHRIRELAAGHRDLEGRWTMWDEQLPDGRELVRAADIGVIHSSGSEAICRIALEYMASSIPLIATRIGALPEVIDEERSGLLVPAGDAGALAGGICRLLWSPMLRNRISEAGLHRLGTLFTHETALKRMESTLTTIAG